MLNLLQNAGASPARSLFRTFRHLGPLGLFFLAILDSSPIPTFGGPDILIAILVTARHNPWWEDAAVATAGSVIGAYLTFRLARKAGEAYLSKKFGESRVSSFLRIFKEHGTGTLVATTAVPFPFPTSMVFAAAGVSDYPQTRFVTLVAWSRAVRYSGIALIAEHYGRHFVRTILHPAQNLGWLALFAAMAGLLIGGGILFNRRLTTAPAQ
jgi:membrane protein YqaA with SNARE-associated domain